MHGKTVEIYLPIKKSFFYVLRPVHPYFRPCFSLPPWLLSFPGLTSVRPVLSSLSPSPIFTPLVDSPHVRTARSPPPSLPCLLSPHVYGQRQQHLEVWSGSLVRTCSVSLCSCLTCWCHSADSYSLIHIFSLTPVLAQ